MIEELRQQLAHIIPLNVNDRKFIEEVREYGEIRPSLITNNVNLACQIARHPAISWAEKKAKI
ncbi:MAG: hypothetical protein K0R73_996 [Candidatus Midichloriaceae bacterium]|jgi:hypothetical protein|nr:hypothetical protein [Candidatus Midichloriaceae bacterium]